MKRMAYLMMVGLVAAAEAAIAQSFAPTGQWNCTFGVRDTSPRQRPAVMQQFQMMVQNDGWAYGNGIVSSGAGSYQFQFQGNWQMVGSEFALEAQQNSYLGPQPFYFSSVVHSGTQMAFNERAADGNITATSCQR